MKSNTLKLSFVLLVVCAVFLMGGCATTQQAKKAETSGFLWDYSQLQKGSDEKALLSYVNPNVNFSDYNKVLLDHVAIWRSKDSDIEDVPKEELKNLSHYLYSAVKKQLKGDYMMVEKPGPNTMRIRMAFTEIGGATVPLDIATTYLPPARLISEGKKLATGTHSFVGDATIEIEILDSLSNKRLAAAVDTRAGGKHYKGSTDKWADVKQAADYWAGRIRAKLAEFRTR